MKDAELGRVAALDIGDRRIGVALSDPLGYTAQPLLTYTRVPGNPTSRENLRRDVKSLLRLLRKQGCRRIIVGSPIYLSGRPSPSSNKVAAFVGVLRAETDLPIELWDERLSTTAAHELLDDAGRAQHDRKAIIDQVAAVLILEGYMQAHRPAELLPHSSGQT